MDSGLYSTSDSDHEDNCPNKPHDNSLEGACLLVTKTIQFLEWNASIREHGGGVEKSLYSINMQLIGLLGSISDLDRLLDYCC